MKKIFTACIFTFFTSISLIAQSTLDNCERLKKTSQWDSLIFLAHNAWQQYTESDGAISPNAIKAISYLGNAYWNVNERDTAIIYQEKYCSLLCQSMSDTAILVARAYRILGNFHLIHQDFAEAKSIYDFVLSIVEQVPIRDSTLLSQTFNGIGQYYYEIANFEKALATHNKALAIRIALRDSLLMAQTYNNIGNCYIEKGVYYEAIRFHSMALDIRKRHLTPGHSDIGQSYQNLGNCYYYLEDYEYAKEMAEAALSIYRISGNVLSNDNAQLLGNLGNILAEMSQYEKANEYINNAITVLRSLNEETTVEMARLFDNLGNNYYYQCKYSEAINYYQKALVILEKLPAEGRRQQPRILINLGNSLFDGGNYLGALGYYQQSMEIFSSRYESHHLFRVYCTMNTANSYKKLGNFDKANALLDSVQQTFTQRNLQENKNKNTIIMIDYLADRADVHWHQFLKDSSVENAQKAWDILYQAIDTLLAAKDELRWERSKMALYKDFRHLFEEGINIAKTLYEEKNLVEYRNRMFELSGLSKGLILNDALRKTHFSSLSNVPDSLIDKMVILNQQLAKLQQERESQYEADIKQRDHIALGELSEQVIQKKAEWIRLQEQIKTYTDVLEVKKPMSLLQVQQRLKPNQCILEFFMGKKTKYLFVVRKDTCLMHPVAAQIPISDWVERLRMGLMFPNGDDAKNLSARAASSAYIESASNLYTALITPIKSWLREEVIIIPDGILHYVPFEALLKTFPSDYGNYRTYPFLLKDHAISYNFSSSLHFSMSEKAQKVPPKPSFAIFAPFFKHKCSDFAELPYSLTETISVGNTSNPINPRFFWGKTCTDSLFIQQAPAFDILHISTHGSFSDLSNNNTFIVYANCKTGRLFPRNIYALPLKASMVYINGCHTNEGQLLEGEGITGVCRAFAHAGAASVIANDWVVRDKSADKISSAFYDNIFREKTPATKAVALQTAKLQFLLSDQNPTTQHPHYWIGTRIWGHAGLFFEK
jgi:CHAT domain-containing protein